MNGTAVRQGKLLRGKIRERISVNENAEITLEKYEGIWYLAIGYRLLITGSLDKCIAFGLQKGLLSKTLGY